MKRDLVVGIQVDTFDDIDLASVWPIWPDHPAIRVSWTRRNDRD